MSSKKRTGSNDIQSSLSKRQTNSFSSVSTFTILPNEIIITVFEYLKPFDIIVSFSNLNRQLTWLIQQYKQNVNLCGLTDTQIEQIVPLICKDIISLTVDRNLFVNDLFQQFPSLQHLSILKISLSFSEELLPFVQAFQRLTKLKLKCRSDTMIFPGTKLIKDEFLPHIFQRNCALKAVAIVPVSQLTDDTIARFSPCNLTKVEVHLTAGRDLFILFNYLPYIESFKCRMSYSISKKDLSTSTVDTPYLREFALENTNYTTEFTVIASFLKQRTSLEKLSLFTKLTRKSQDVDGNRLQKELLQDLVHLKLFDFHLIVEHQRDDQPIDMTKVIPTFQTEFWLKEHDWKVGGRNCKNDYSSYSCLFSLPLGFTSFGPALMSSSFSQLKTAVPLSSDLFHNVRSLDIEIDHPDKTMPILKFVHRYFSRIRYLSLCNNNDNHRLILSPTELANIRFPTVKIFKFYDQYYDRKHYEDLKQLFGVCPNLTDLHMNRYDLENASSYLYEHDGDQDILQLKHLHTFTVETDNTFQGSTELSEMVKEFKERFRERLPKIVLRWITPYGEQEEDTDDEDEDEDED